MSQVTITKTTSIVTRLTQASGDAIHVFFDPELLTLPPGYTSPDYFSVFIQSLRCKIAVPSIEEASIPNLDPELSRAERILNIREIEWNSPRREFEILQRKMGRDWVPLFSVAALRRDPYYSINLLKYLTDNADYPVGSDSSLGVRAVDAGYGLLGTGDELTFFGSAYKEAWVLPQVEAPIGNCTRSQASVGNTTTTIAPQNPNRKYLIITNNSGGACWLSLGQPASFNQGILLTGLGASYEITASNLYRGEIAAISEATSQLLVTECI